MGENRNCLFETHRVDLSKVPGHRALREFINPSVLSSYERVSVSRVVNSVSCKIDLSTWENLDFPDMMG